MLAPFLAIAVSAAAPQNDTTYLYRALMIRAAPGALDSVIDLLLERQAVITAAGDPAPLLMRHRQGDHWDLMLIYPMDSFRAYYAADRIARRATAATAAGLSDAEFEGRLARWAAWREDVFVRGPPEAAFRAVAASGSLYHIEMFVAIPDRRAALFEQRLMENVYSATIDRPQNLVFTRVAGAAWDLFTLGVYTNMTHFAASEHIPAERKRVAARAAGFAGPDAIGTYLRTLILRHHDTLAGPPR